MVERTQLGEMILKHWRENRPQMVRDLEQQNRLEQAVNEAQELTGDLLYELVSVQKLDYQAAWEMATREWALLPSETRRPQSSAEEIETEAGGAPVAGLPDNGIPPDRQGSLREKALANIAAIRTLKQIEAENRDATEAEKAMLARYSGLGRAGECLPALSSAGLARRSPAQLRELLTNEEYDAARASTPNAHFTSPLVIEAMWQAMQRFGLGSGRADPRALDGRRAFLRPDAGGSAARQPQDRRRAGQHHGADRAAALSRTRRSSPRASRRRRCPTISSTR